ncbi:MAG: GNAT family N-acetyltransferase [Pseudomonadota bacterium]
MPNELTTKRLTLRTLRPSDAGLMTLYCGDPRVARMTAAIPHPYPPGTAEAFIEAVLAGRNTEEIWAMDATQIGSSELVGVVGFKPEKRKLGYWVGPPFWNTGMASEAVEAVVDYLLGKRRVPQITASVFTDNPASAQVLNKLGFEPGQVHQTFSVGRDGIVDTRDFTVTHQAAQKARAAKTIA